MPYRRKKMTFAISSPDEFLLLPVTAYDNGRLFAQKWKYNVLGLGLVLVRVRLGLSSVSVLGLVFNIPNADRPKIAENRQCVN